MIEVKDLSFSYHSQFKTLENISFSIDEGEIFGFLGPNGSGKSTTQKLMIGILKKYIGNINIMGKEICDWDNEIYNHISVLFEYPYLYSNLNAYDNLNYFASFYPKSQRQDMDELLDRLDFDKNYRNKLASTYSKGMRQRLSMARALISSPKILFLDEPTSGLDPAGAVLFRKLINEERAKGMTIFLTTHNMQDAEILCDRIAFIVDGKIAAINSPKNYREKYAKDQIIIK
ncbi:MAG: ABC transporter ATP-binding protein, partial [Tissierellia bacterium]|nr:ABC transporter ATP-binding protein [Tissierellia bacterium]